MWSPCFLNNQFHVSLSLHPSHSLIRSLCTCPTLNTSFVSYMVVRFLSNYQGDSWISISTDRSLITKKYVLTALYILVIGMFRGILIYYILSPTRFISLIIPTLLISTDLRWFWHWSKCDCRIEYYGGCVWRPSNQVRMIYTNTYHLYIYDDYICIYIQGSEHVHVFLTYIEIAQTYTDWM